MNATADAAPREQTMARYISWPGLRIASGQASKHRFQVGGEQQ